MQIKLPLLLVDLGIDESYKELIQKYSKFFSSAERVKKFYSLEIRNYTKDIIELSIMSILCKTKTLSFEEILREIITDKDFEKGKRFKELEKYNLLNPFWEMCEKLFGYSEEEPNLSNLVYTLLVTYTAKTINKEVSKSLKGYQLWFTLI